MLSIDQVFAFLGAAILITLSPGPDNLMVLSLGAAQGRLRGMLFGLGCAIGCLSHTVLAALGVSALISANPLAFASLKIAGGLYLVYLGWQALMSQNNPQMATGQTATNPWQLFRRGLVANAINPKVVMFFLAFLPQFTRLDHGHVSWQIAQLGLLFTAQAALIFGTLGYFAGTIGQALQRKPRAGIWLDRIAGCVFIALGLKLIVDLPI